MSQELYYTAPSEEAFEEVKQEAIKIWSSYDDTFGYASEKVDRIKNIANIRDNFMHMVAMFDSENQEKLKSAVSAETLKAIQERLT